MGEGSGILDVPTTSKPGTGLLGVRLRRCDGSSGTNPLPSFSLAINPGVSLLYTPGYGLAAPLGLKRG